MININTERGSQLGEGPASKKRKKELSTKTHFDNGVNPKKLKSSQQKLKKDKKDDHSKNQQQSEPAAKSQDSSNPKKVKTSKDSKFTKKEYKNVKPISQKFGKRTFDFKSKKAKDLKPGAPTDWVEFKKKKREVQVKRKQSKSFFELSTQAKKICETLRRKRLQGGNEQRNNLVLNLHKLLGNQGNYSKFALAHDMSRVVQYLLKFGTEDIRNEVSKELIPSTVQMLQSNYGKYCLKRMLKYGSAQTRSCAIRSMYGNAVKLTSHAVSAPIFEYAYSTWASPIDKQYLIQEFFGDMYKQSKDNGVKHLQDVYRNSQDMKNAALGATKANLSRVLNKCLLDSGLIQSVMYQFLTECNVEDRNELITQLASHVVILSNSRDGARVVMECIWHGTNKDKKVIMKAIKEHTLDLAKHEHGHCAMITLLDAVDDTVLLQKIVLSELIKHMKELIEDEWGRKILLWLVAPANSTYFHPAFVKELDAGRESATCKKTPAVRRKELLEFCIPVLLNHIASETNSWLSKSSIAVVALAALKAGSGDDLKKALNSVVRIVADPKWTIKDGDVDVLGIEHPGLHMVLKKLAQHDKMCIESKKPTFGEALVEEVTADAIKSWIKLNRGCFLLVALFENGSSETRNILKEKLSCNLKKLSKQDSAGAKILVNKLK